MGKIKQLKDRNQEFTIDLIDLFCEMDPTKTNKYVPYMVKKTKKYMEMVRKQMMEKNFQELFDLVQDFEELSDRDYIKDKDIYTYNRLVDLREVVDKGRQEKDIKEIDKDNADLLYKDDEYVLIYPKTLEGSQIYGRATKWCTSATKEAFANGYGVYEHPYFEHLDNGKLLYLICRKKDPITQRFAKVAFFKKTEGAPYPTNVDYKDGLTGWDVKDTKLTYMDLQHVMSSLPKDLNDKISDFFEL